MNKRGFEIQFNWIFILVAGALILLFFSTLIIKQKNLSRESTNAAILRSFESIISGASVSMDTTNIMGIPQSEITVRCGTISIGKASKQLSSMILFSPGVIKGNRLITQTHSLDIPYRATNLLMVTSPNIKYILIGDDSLISLVNKTLPLETRKESFASYNPSLIKSASTYRVKIVSTSSSFPAAFPAAFLPMSDDSVSAIRIIGDENSGKAQFYQKKGNSWAPEGETNYFGRGSLIALVFSDFEIYKCSISNAFLKAEAVSSVYLERTASLIGMQECDAIYNQAIAKIGIIRAMKADNIQSTLSSISELKDLNKEAQRKSCPLIY